MEFAHAYEYGGLNMVFKQSKYEGPCAPATPHDVSVTDISEVDNVEHCGPLQPGAQAQNHPVLVYSRPVAPGGAQSGG